MEYYRHSGSRLVLERILVLKRHRSAGQTLMPSILRNLIIAAPLLALGLSAAELSSSQLEKGFNQTVKPFITTYCVGCHSGNAPAASFDIKAYTSTAAVAKDFAHLSRISARVGAKEMPPKPVPAPPDEKRQQFVDWINAFRRAEARKNAGDPGVVLARRLSNSEYNYTIRDLTGQDLKPAKEFPVDPANTEGFDNSGESLSMSSSLLNKYLRAAHEVTDHMVLKPDGFDFAPHPMLVETDREKYTILRIVNFYKSQPTDYADYFQAAWRYKHRVALGKPTATLDTVAAESKVSARYLKTVWQFLETPPDTVGPVDTVQAMWKALPGPSDETVRAKCIEMRNFVTRIRSHTAMQFASPIVKGLSSTSQPLMNWKLKNFASSRRKFDPKTLRLDTDAPPEVAATLPKMAGLGQEAAVRWAARTLKERVGDKDLVIPAAQKTQYEASFAHLADVFPDAFYISERGRFFPDDSEDKGRLLSAGYHNVMGYYRDDTPLIELVLDDKGKAELEKLWLEFEYIAEYTTRTYTQYYFNQSGEILGTGRESGSERPEDKAVTDEAVIFGLRDQYLKKAVALATNDPVALQAINEHFARVNSTLRGIERIRIDAAPKHLEAVMRFAARAYRRPLAQTEKDDLLAFYNTLRRKGELTHEEAIRDTLVSILMAPEFCYRVDLAANQAGRVTLQTVAAKKPQALTDYALASRLSYLLWSSMPDDQLLAAAAAGELRKPAGVLAQTHRMLKDDRARALATEFAGNWLDYRHFEDIASVDRERFPMFTNDLRDAMFQEPIRFIDDVIRSDRSVLDLLYGKHTFVNPVLAKHYGMPETKATPDEWTRVDDASPYGRGGILPMATFLTQNSPGLRTSPVKRGYWVARRVLGEVIPPPPPVVPELPKDEAASDMPLRQMLEKHRANPLCASCHARFDSFGLAFEGYGPVGNKREKDLAGRAVDTQATFPGGIDGKGLDGLKSYIHENREKDFLDNICRKLTAYSLGRTLIVSDEPLVEAMKAKLASSGYKFSTLIDSLVTSPQFMYRRPATPVDPRPDSKNDKNKGAIAYAQPKINSVQQN